MCSKKLFYQIRPDQPSLSFGWLSFQGRYDLLARKLVSRTIMETISGELNDLKIAIGWRIVLNFGPARVTLWIV